MVRVGREVVGGHFNNENSRMDEMKQLMESLLEYIYILGPQTMSKRPDIVKPYRKQNEPNARHAISLKKNNS